MVASLVPTRSKNSPQDNTDINSSFNLKGASELTDKEILQNLSKFYGYDMALSDLKNQVELRRAYEELLQTQKTVALALQEGIRGFTLGGGIVFSEKSQFMTFLVLLGCDEVSATKLWEKNNSHGTSGRIEAFHEIDSIIHQASETYDGLNYVCKNIPLLKGGLSPISKKLKESLENLEKIKKQIKEITNDDEPQLEFIPVQKADRPVYKTHVEENKKSDITQALPLDETKKEPVARVISKILEAAQGEKRENIKHELTYLENEILIIRSAMKGAKADSLILGLRLSSLEEEAKNKRKLMESYDSGVA